MCHLVLLMPVLALPIFWLMPLSFAIPIYIFIALISGLLYRLIAKSMKRRPATGAESLIGDKAEVVSKSSTGDRTQYLVRSQGELWSARCLDILQPGETVNITALDGLRLVVERSNSDSIAKKRTGRGANERHYH